MRIVRVKNSKNLFRFQDTQSKARNNAKASLRERFEMALAAEEAGSLECAFRLYESIVSQDGGHVGAAVNLGVLCFEVGKLDMAKEGSASSWVGIFGKFHNKISG